MSRRKATNVAATLTALVATAMVVWGCNQATGGGSGTGQGSGATVATGDGQTPAESGQAASVRPGNERTNVDKNPVVVMKTSEGTIRIELWADKAPITVGNFLRYVDEGFYDGTIFHRVIPNFMIQGGGFTPDMRQKDTHEQIKNEARADVPNDRGTLAMARTNVVDSATAQFFINVVDNDFLTHKDETARGFGYAVFGKVTEGMDVVDRIRKVATKSVGPYDDVPAKPVFIESVKRAE